MKSKPIKIELVGGPVYSGRDKGQDSRDTYQLDTIDKTPGMSVKVIAPEDTYTITSSYFLGLFGESLNNLNSKKIFFEKYHFLIPD